MFSLNELTSKFNALSEERRNEVFAEATANASLYNKLIPNVPLLLYILEGESRVPVSQHGPIIESYKAWRDKQK
jgi:hypothetical protein